MDHKKLSQAESALRRAGHELRTAWTLLKHHGMEPTAKELADTVLDVEVSADQLRDFLATVTPNVLAQGRAACGASPGAEGWAAQSHSMSVNEPSVTKTCPLCQVDGWSIGRATPSKGSLHLGQRGAELALKCPPQTQGLNRASNRA